MIDTMQTLQNSPSKVAQPEHYLAVLRTVSLLNWVGLGALLLMLALLDQSSTAVATGSASSRVFWLLFVEALIANGILTLALIFRGWYRRTPREALNKLRMLAAAVCLWEILHLAGLYEFFGGVFGPFAVLFPAMVLASFFILPSRSALSVAFVICAAWLVVSILQWTQVLYPLGALGGPFLDPAAAASSRIVLMGAAMLVCLVGGALWRHQMDAALQGHYPLQLIDTRFDCFSREALYNRLCDETERARGSAASSCVVILHMEKVAEVVADKGLDAAEARLIELARAVRTITRHNLDTLAYLGNARFALLLPTLPSSAGEDVVARILQVLADDMSCTIECQVVALPEALDTPAAAEQFIAQHTAT
ncbi:diguanylate cyclase [Oceanococcus atlanticus]|uniref:Diguanylate cyclase n=2 Tax=Oceanococcus atlanticus TaxID=1317117 RepID=A0A1Y1SC86_9GAMM|nr:diguanylate cyclase [Oceanococcus atlanticus]